MLAALCGCYSQRLLTEPVPQAGMRIVAEVTDSGAVAMGNAIGSGALEVEGIVVSVEPGTWRLQMLRVDQRDGRSTPWNHEVVPFPRFALSQVQERRLDRARSWLAAGLFTASVVGVAMSFRLIGSEELGGSVVQPPQ